MFRRKKKPEAESLPEAEATQTPGLTAPPEPAAAPAASSTEGPRRMPEFPSPSLGSIATPTTGPNQAPRRVNIPNMPMLGGQKQEAQEGKRLTVGKDISLSGEINSCDILAVEGRVEATLVGGRAIEITDGGHFKGNAEIDTADIAGRYEGDLVVRDRLTIRSTGKILGKVRYRRLEVELGGEMVGDIATLDVKPDAGAE